MKRNSVGTRRSPRAGGPATNETGGLGPDVGATKVEGWPWRGYVAGTVGVIAASMITPYSSLYLNSSQLGVDYLPITAFCLFLILVGANAALRRLGLALTRTDLLVAYLMMLVAAAVPASGFMSRLLPALAAQYYLATEQNAWSEYLWRLIPSWIGPTDREVIRTFYEGSPDGTVPWSAWLAPLATWSIPFVATGLIILSLGALLRRQWIERERLTFPLTQVPLSLVGGGDRPTVHRALLGNWVFWIAFAIPFVVRGVNGLHYYYRAVPHVAAMDPFFRGFLREFFEDPTLAAIYKDIYFEIHFALVGVAMLVRKEVSLSFWSFQVIFCVLAFLFHVSGMGMGEHVYTPQWTFGYRMFSRDTRVGALLVVAALTIWSLRWMVPHVRRIMFHPSEAKTDDDRLLRWPVWGILAGMALYFPWALAIGMDGVTAAAILVMGIAVFVVVARIVCEGGLLWCSVSLDPGLLWPFIVGTTSLNAQTVTAMSYANYVPFATRANVLPSVMDGLKISHTSGFRPRYVFIAALIALPIAFVASAAFVLALTYDKGGNFMSDNEYKFGPDWMFNRTIANFLYPAGPSWPAIWTIVAGAGIMGSLYVLHRRHLWWPLYPLGYVLADSAVMVHQWFSLFIGWALRVLVTRTWGLTGYRNVVPAALGVIIGDLASVFLWFIIDALNGTTGRMMTHHTSTW